MQLSIHGKNHLEVTQALRDHVAQRLGRLDRYFSQDGDPPPAQVVLSVQRERQAVEVSIPLDGLLLRAEEAEPSMYAAVDLVVDKLERQLVKYRARLHPRHRPDPARGAPAAPAAEAEEGDGAVMRVKRFPLKPMTVEEALLQMNLLGHDFFVFREAGTLDVQVLYRRREGGFGLIETR